jgi:surface protein
MKKFLFAFVCLMVMGMQDVMAQLSSNPYKFLGNTTTSGSVDAGNGIPAYYTLWNQITCENESKWLSVEETRGIFNWRSDKAFNYAQEHNFPYTFHSLVWGAQYPSWLVNLSATDRLTALTNWFDNVKAKYNTLPMINVANEAVGYHQQGNSMMKETLGGAGKTGYDWLIKAFEMAYERWPDAILIYNDYNSIRWDIDNYITLVRTLRDAGAPIDAYGNEGHELSEISESELSSALKKQQDALQMPMFVTELDIDIADDSQQKAQYQKVLPLIWEAPYCAGVTLWGYIHGATWVDDSGLYKNGAERPAMTWIKEYMASDAAKNAVSAFPNTKKEASIYIRPAALKVAKDDVLPVKVHARLATKTIEKVDLYVNDELVQTMTEAPYMTEVSSSKTGWNTTKAIITATDGSTYERYGRFQVLNTTIKRSTYNETAFQIPGTINVVEYDNGATGITYSKASRNDTTATKDDQWMEYTVDVQSDGYYTLDMEVAATNNGGTFHLSEYSLDSLTFFTDFIEVPNTGSTTDFQTLSCPMKEYLTAGRHVFCLNIDKGGFYIKNLTFKNNSADIVTPEPYAVLSDDNTVLTFYYDGQKSARNGLDLGPFSYPDYQSWSGQSRKITNVVFDASFADYAELSNTSYWFRNCANLTTITGIENLNTSNVEDMSSMFDGCAKLTGLDVSHFNTSKVTSFWGTFFGCRSLTSLDLSGFSTENVEYVNYMFDGCAGLTSLDLSSFSTPQLKYMYNMFDGCSNLMTIDMRNFTTARVTSMDDLFVGCTSLVAIHAGGANIPDSLYAGIGNPNLLVYVNDASVAPTSIQNVVVNGVAKEIVLTDEVGTNGNNNFFVPQSFTAEKVSYTRNFTQQTQPNVSRGWESISLPFNVQNIVHESKGDLSPFGSPAEGKKFWLRRLADNGLTRASQIEANVPYVISMPNSTEYTDLYNLAGRVTFSSQYTTVPATTQQVLSLADSSIVMMPTTLRVNRSSSVWAINVGEVRGQYLEGSVFERDYREVRPFEAYTVHRSNGPAPRFVPIIEMDADATGIEDVRSLMSDGRDDQWYDLKGNKLQQKPTHKGVYILNGTKVVIK